MNKYLLLYIILFILYGISSSHNIRKQETQHNDWRVTIALKLKNRTLSPLCVGVLSSPGTIIADASCFFDKSGTLRKNISDYAIVFDKPVVHGIRTTDKEVFPISRVVYDQTLSSPANSFAVASLVICRPIKDVTIWQHQSDRNLDTNYYVHTWENPCNSNNHNIGKYIHYWRTKSQHKNCSSNYDLCLRVSSIDWKCGETLKWSSQGGGIVVNGVDRQINMIGITVASVNTTTFNVIRVSQHYDFLKKQIKTDLCSSDAKPIDGKLSPLQHVHRSSLPLRSSPVFLNSNGHQKVHGHQKHNGTKNINIKTVNQAKQVASDIIKEAQLDARVMAQNNGKAAKDLVDHHKKKHSTNSGHHGHHGHHHHKEYEASPISSTPLSKAHNNKHHHNKHHHNKHHHTNHNNKHNAMNSNLKGGKNGFNVEPGKNVLVVTPDPDPARKNTIKQYFKLAMKPIPKNETLDVDLKVNQKKVNWKKLGMTGHEAIDYRIRSHAKGVLKKVTGAHRNFLRQKDKNCAGTWCGKQPKDD